jgi:hypothetical protein
MRRLSVDLLARGTELDELRSFGFTLPAIAGILRSRCSSDSDFAEKVRQSLYRDFPFFPGGVGKLNRSEFVQYVKINNPTLRAVASLCAMRHPGERLFSCNPGIRAIVTFNLDALLQAYVYARYEKRLLRTIERASASHVPEKISIYHMHGFLRFDEKRGDAAREAADKIVFTEHAYFDFFNSPTSMFNYTFLHLLRETPCLFMGLSLQDENIRRLLHYSRRERIRSLCEEGEPLEKAEAKSLRHFAVLRTHSEVVDSLVECSLQQLGITVLWVNDFEEVPDQLAEMYESAGMEWSLVH